MSLVPGTRLGPYEITAQIGVGGMGEVYRATDTNLKRAVAIKVLPGAVASDAERLARFQREAEVLASLNHPNIASIYGLERADGTTALVMELVEGETIADHIARGPMSLSDALPIARQITEALEAAHEQGIIHRDLKPANIKVRGDGVVKVLDFGLAKLVESPSVGSDATVSPTITSPALMTGVGVLLGTAAYMSPEQVKGQNADKRSDIWAFGCVVYEMLTGRRAFDGQHVADTLGAVMHKPIDWSSMPAKTPAHIGLTLERCLERDPKRRFRDIADVQLALAGAFESPAPVRAISPVASRRFRVQVAAALIAAMGVSVVLTWLLTRPPSVEPQPLRFTIPQQPAVVSETAGRASIPISPDGRFIAFIANRITGPQQVWVHDFEVNDSHPLPGTEGATDMFWSPDSRFIGFFAGGEIKKTVATGGSIQRVAPALNATGGAWSKDDFIIFGRFNGGLMRVSANGGSPQPAVELDRSRGETGQIWPLLLPDRRRVVYLSLTGTGREIAIASLDSRESRSLARGESRAFYVPRGYLVYQTGAVFVARPFDANRGEFSGDPSPIGEDIRSFTNGNTAFSVSDAGVLAFRSGSLDASEMIWHDRSGRQMSTLGEPGPYRQLSISPDDKRIAVHLPSLAGGAEIWLVDAQRGAPFRFITDRLASSPVWSPAGRELAYMRFGSNEIFRKPIDGVGESRLVAVPGVTVIEDWSRDGYLAYLYDAGIWAVSLTGNGKPFQVVASGSGIDEPQFSPNARWLAFNSSDMGRSEVYVVPFPGPGAPVRVSLNGGVQPKWRADGNELFFLAPDGMLMAVNMTMANTSIVPGVPQSLFPTGLTPPLSHVDQYAVTGDARRFLVLRPVKGSSLPPVTVVFNWPVLPKR